MAGPFKLRSGNGPLKFKNMGSSPVKDRNPHVGTKDDKGNDWSHVETDHTPGGIKEMGLKTITEKDIEIKEKMENLPTKTDAEAKWKKLYHKGMSGGWKYLTKEERDFLDDPANAPE